MDTAADAKVVLDSSHVENDALRASASLSPPKHVPRTNLDSLSGESLTWSPPVLHCSVVSLLDRELLEGQVHKLTHLRLSQLAACKVYMHT